MKHEVIPEPLWDQIRMEFITRMPFAGPYQLGKIFNVRGRPIKQRAAREHWRKLRDQWQENKCLPDTIQTQPILTTNISEPIVRDFFCHYYRHYLNMLPMLSRDAVRLSEKLQTLDDPGDISYLVTARDKILERTRIILGVMAPGQIKDVPKNRRGKLPAPVPSGPNPFAMPAPVPLLPPAEESSDQPVDEPADQPPQP